MVLLDRSMVSFLNKKRGCVGNIAIIFDIFLLNLSHENFTVSDKLFSVFVRVEVPAVYSKTP